MDNDEFKIKDSIQIEGIAEDYVWWQSEYLKNNMQMWSSQFERLIKTMDARHREHIKMLQDVMYENHSLKKQIKEIKGE